MQAAVDFRADLLRRGGCRLQIEGSADVEDRIYDFTLDSCLYCDGSTKVKVLKPEDLSGITANTDGKTGKLHYDEVSVEFGTFEDERLAPISAPAALINAWTGGYLSSCGPEDELLLAVYELGYDSDTITVYTWFDENGTPVRAELAHRGKVSLRLTFSNFELLSGGENETTEENLGGRVPGQSGP